MVDIPFPTTSAKDDEPRAGPGNMINVIMEQLQDGTINRKRAPGITQFTTNASGNKHCRGFILINSGVLLIAYDDVLESITNDNGIGASVELGPLAGTQLITMARNNAAPNPDIVAVTENGAFQLFTDSPPVDYPSSEIGSPNSVCFCDGFFMFTYGNGDVQASDLNSTNINSLNRARVESSSSGLLRGMWFGQLLYLFTPTNIEVWSDTANPSGFPFSRSTVIARGLMAATAVAGVEDKWSSELVFVGSDGIVYLLQGQSPTRISTHDIERRIQALQDKTSLRACVYMNDGHSYWQITCDDFTEVYDLTTSTWEERQSYGMSFSRMECSINAFDKWIVGDFNTDNLGIIDGNSYNEYGGPLVYTVISLPMANFPNKTAFPRVDFNFIAGVGKSSGSAIDPQVMISWSDDGGATFKMPIQRPLGKIGEKWMPVSVLRSGQASRYGRVWKLQVSDDCYVGLLSGNTVEV